MKEVTERTGHKFSYGADIQRSPENEIKTKVPLSTRLTGNGYDR